MLRFVMTFNIQECHHFLFLLRQVNLLGHFFRHLLFEACGFLLFEACSFPVMHLQHRLARRHHATRIGSIARV
jgi:hypothetical protein